MADRIHCRVRSDVVTEVHHGRNHCDEGAEQRNENCDTQPKPEQSMIEEDVVESVGRKVFCELLGVGYVTRRPAVHRIVLDLHIPPSMNGGGVRVFGSVGMSVMFAMYRYPLTRSNSGREPQHKAKCSMSRLAECQRLVRKPPMEIHRRRQVGDRGDCAPQRNCDDEAEIPSNIKGNHPNYPSKGSRSVKRAKYTVSASRGVLNVCRPR